MYKAAATAACDRRVLLVAALLLSAVVVLVAQAAAGGRTGSAVAGAIDNEPAVFQSNAGQGLYTGQGIESRTAHHRGAAQPAGTVGGEQSDSSSLRSIAEPKLPKVGSSRSDNGNDNDDGNADHGDDDDVLESLPPSLRRLRPVVHHGVWGQMLEFFDADAGPRFRIMVQLVAPENGRAMEDSACRNTLVRELSRQDGDRPYSTKFAAELLVPAAIRKSPYYTTKAAEANLVLIEACIIGRGQQGQHIPELVPTILSDPVLGARWKKHNGADHVLILTGDHGPCLLFRERAGRNDFFRLRDKKWHDKSIANATFLMNEGSVIGGCYNAAKDIVIPTSVISTALDPTTRCKRPAHAPPHARRHRVFLGGGKSSSKLREALNSLYLGAPGFYAPTDRIPQEEFLCEMADSVFCLAPRGQAAWSPRLDEAIAAGCIPVLLSDDYEPPFSHVLDYSRFALRVARKDIANLDEILANVTASEITRLLDGVRRVAPVFRYAPYDSSLPYQGNDMTPLLIFDLWRKHSNQRVLHRVELSDGDSESRSLHDIISGVHPKVAARQSKSA